MSPKLSRSILILSLLVSTQNLIMIQIGFALRQDFIASELCINRNKPHVKCGGFCYLSKKMHESTQDEEDRRNIANLQIALALQFMPLFYSAPSLDLAACSWIKSGKDKLLTGVSTEIFQPPRISRLKSVI